MQETTNKVLKLEDDRCAAIAAQDWERVRALLSPSLIHTHTRGNSDDLESYMRYLQETVEILELRREGLRVVPVGDDVAVMHGKQFNRARARGKADAAEVRVEATATQVWAREGDGQWRLVAFQATSLGPPPPALAR